MKHLTLLSRWMTGLMALIASGWLTVGCGGGNVQQAVALFDVNCNNYGATGVAVYKGQQYSCNELTQIDPGTGQLAICTETDITYRFACCSCNEALCGEQTACVTVTPNLAQADSCMKCHNGATVINDYSGTGLPNPHPFGQTDFSRYMSCTTCHGGNAGSPEATLSRLESHTLMPPQLSGVANGSAVAVNFFTLIDQFQTQANNNNNSAAEFAWWNSYTLAGIDRLTDFYPADSTKDYCYTMPDATERCFLNKDFLNFMNPGDLRVVYEGRGCGTSGCHNNHAVSVFEGNPFALGQGLTGGANRAHGMPNRVDPTDTQGFDLGMREMTSSYAGSKNAAYPGSINQLTGWETTALYNEAAGNLAADQPYGLIDNNNGDLLTDIANPIYNNNAALGLTGQVRANNSNLAELMTNQVIITCGDCHLGTAGANNRFGDFRSSGCTTCHMRYSPDGKSASNDPNTNKLEPANPDAIAAPERPHVMQHYISNYAHTEANGVSIPGVSDYACVDCHQGSNRTVLQYWGIRLDQNADLANGQQYPANPATFTNTAEDERLFVQPYGSFNNTFNGRNQNQYILEEDYDGDGRDDTPPDIHYAAGLGCIDCHTSMDLHNRSPDPTNPLVDAAPTRSFSNMSAVVQIRCESCHGGIDSLASTVTCTPNLAVQQSTAPVNLTAATLCATDAKGRILDHVVKVGNTMYLVGMVDGQQHTIPQVKTISTPAANGQTPNPNASFAHGRANGNIADGIGPLQGAGVLDNTIQTAGFSHLDNMECASCHSSWANTCIGCHLVTGFDANPANFFFDNFTGDRIDLFQRNADFTYIHPGMNMPLIVGPEGKISQGSPGMQMFYNFYDANGNPIFDFNGNPITISPSNRNGLGVDPQATRLNANTNEPVMGGIQTNRMMAHSIRGDTTAAYEGPKYCVSCHNTQAGATNATFLAQYAAFVAAYDTTTLNTGAIDFTVLQSVIGQNTGNVQEHPIPVHRAAGLGSGAFLFDQIGCPVNPLDNNANRILCFDFNAQANQAPAARFAAQQNHVWYDADKLVQTFFDGNAFVFSGVENMGNNAPFVNGAYAGAAQLRSGSTTAAFSGPLGIDLQRRLIGSGPAANQICEANTTGGLCLTGWLDGNGAAQGTAAVTINVN